MNTDNTNICYVSYTEAGYEVLRNLLDHSIDVDNIIPLTPDQGARYSVSAYHSMEPLADVHDIPVYYPETYEMDTDDDIYHFQTMDPDIVIVNTGSDCPKNLSSTQYR